MYNWFNGLPLMKKMGLFIVVAGLSLFLVGFTGYRFLVQSDLIIKDMYKDNLVPISLMQENRGHQRAIQSLIIEIMLSSDMTVKNTLKTAINERAKRYNDNEEQIKKINLDVQQKKLIEEIDVTMAQYRKSRDSALALAMENKNAEAYILYKKEVEPNLQNVNNKIRELAEYTTKKAELEEKRSENEISSAIQLLIGIGCGALVIISLFGLGMAKAIASGIRGAVDHLGELSKGNFSINVPEQQLALKDEVGSLAKGFHEMQQNLRSLIRTVANSSEQLSASAEQLTASADQSAQASNQVAISITDVATDAERQLKIAGDSSMTVEKMSVGIQQIAVNANEVSSSAEQTATAAIEGSNAINSAIEQMANIEKTVTASAEAVEKLGLRSKEIGHIVEMISGIAGQTNLLALNAAIEAARAGEQGRGFAVVAEEVRKLAEQSQEATKKIADLIGEIQSETGRAVEAMNTGTKEVKSGSGVVAVAGQSFEQIVALINQVTEQVRGISTNIQHMAKGSQAVVVSVNEITETSKNTVGQTQSISAATEEQSASMQEIASSSQALAKLAEELQEAVNVFRV